MNWGQKLVKGFKGLVGALVFYTRLPISAKIPYEIDRIGRFAPVVGLLLGNLLLIGDRGLAWLEVGSFSRAVLLVCLWCLLTGGLHLDGVMDTADGLAVQNPQLRLQVMQDSQTGAFGVMAGGLLLLLKVAFLTDLEYNNTSPYSLRLWALVMAPVWGRWGQVLAIACYPYLRPTGKGAFLKAEMQLPIDFLWGAGCLIFLTGLQIWGMGNWVLGMGLLLGGGTIAWGVGYWFHSRLGGHTGDSYGAVVEWTEVAFLGLVLVVEVVVDRFT
ncbi:MAG: adenosylcobinamide-GDP ribazoletransferase [Coleofasciculaceae cyanobacterium SM2_1_6]|nr:adenosylcobinamide-GDP ribazoletransferase [Coleofasciculaceae cyanobacterium SM2_1_6]